MIRRLLFSLALVLPISALAQDKSQDQSIVVASTTSTQDSGLFGYLLPLFTARTGIPVKVVALGTGQALDMGRRGEADVVLVHAKSAEEPFVAEGFGVRRYPVMYNDFILVGPRNDPAGISKTKDIVEALRSIKKQGAPFVSRGDRSGTHTAERKLWQEAGVDIDKEKGSWYKSTGQGMGATLNEASAAHAYVLTDRGTWLSLKDRGDLAILLQGDERLFNQYSVILVNPAKHPHVKKEAGQKFIDWLISPEGQAAIKDYRVDGQPLFVPNAGSAG